jgi:hypothetical protein
MCGGRNDGGVIGPENGFADGGYVKGENEGPWCPTMDGGAGKVLIGFATEGGG